jgi:hypothetical protein
VKENKFKQLFVIQFHTFFVTDNGIRFTKDQIDGISKDIRYPNEFFIDLIFDENKSQSISAFDEDVSKWKNIISDFILKGYKNIKTDNKEPGNVTSKENDSVNQVLQNKGSEKLNQGEIPNTESQHNDNKYDRKNNEILSSPSESSDDFHDYHDVEKEGDLGDIRSKPNTINKAQELLQKFSMNTDSKSSKKDNDDEDDEDEDIENYLKNLENKTK